MRNYTNKERIEKLIYELGNIIKNPTSLYFTGGATAVWFGIRNSTIDVDISFDPESDEMFKAIQFLKESINMNIELVSPSLFVPLLPEWKKRSIFITSVNKISFFHYDIYSQIIAKIQRGWKQDLTDVKGFVSLIDFDKKLFLNLFNEIKPNFIKYPSVDVAYLENKINKFIDNA